MLHERRTRLANGAPLRVRQALRRRMCVVATLCTVVAAVLLFYPYLFPGDEQQQEPVPTLPRSRTNVNVEPIDAGRPRIHFVTAQNKPTSAWCTMQLTARLSGGIAVDTLGWGSSYSHVKRLQWVLNYLDASVTTAEKQHTRPPLRDDDVVVFMDGSDTFFTGVSADEILNDFVSHTDPSEAAYRARRSLHGDTQGYLQPFLFNAEANCYHQQLFHGAWGVVKGKCISAYKRHQPRPTSKYRYLNAGLWIGRVWAARRVLGAALQVVAEKPSYWWCDQSIFGLLYLHRTDELAGALGIDSENRFFLPTYHFRLATEVCRRDATNSSRSLETESGAFMRPPPPPDLSLCRNGHTPAIVHFNGKSDSGGLLPQLLQRAGWQHRWQTATEQINEGTQQPHGTGTLLTDSEKRNLLAAAQRVSLTLVPMPDGRLKHLESQEKAFTDVCGSSIQWPR